MIFIHTYVICWYIDHVSLVMSVYVYVYVYVYACGVGYYWDFLRVFAKHQAFPYVMMCSL